MSYRNAIQAIRAAAHPESAGFFQKFFRTGPGGYGEGDVFLGLTVPQTRALARQFRDLPFPEVVRLLQSKFHEERLMALVILVTRFERGDEKTRATVFRLYLKHRKFVNNWDLVDVSASHIVGEHLYRLQSAAKILDQLSRSKRLWDRRIAMVATWAFIKKRELNWTFKLAERYLTAPEDLMHKASGWMLREAGKRDERRLRDFLEAHAAAMPRTMLRYALEKLPPADRKRYMGKRAELLAAELSASDRRASSSRTRRTRR